MSPSGAGADRARAGKIRIVLVDDHAVLREGLRLMLQREPDLEVVGEASTADAALQT